MDLSSASESKRKCSMVTQIRWPACIRAWICASITEELSRPRFQRHGSFAAHKRTVAQASGVPALPRADRASRLDGFPRRIGREPCGIHHAFDGDMDARGSLRHAGRYAAAAHTGAELADSLPANVWP